jgi:DNA-binding transcriptional MerR regulator
MATRPKAKQARDPEPAELLSIGELSRRASVSPRTIRYYEELGILPEPPRSAGGTRRYPAEYQFYIEGAILLKDVGFTLDELKLVGRLARGASMTERQRARALAVIEEKMAALEHKIRVLNRVREVFEERTGRRRGRNAGGSNAMADLLELQPRG